MSVLALWDHFGSRYGVNIIGGLLVFSFCLFGGEGVHIHEDWVLVMFIVKVGSSSSSAGMDSVDV